MFGVDPESGGSLLWYERIDTASGKSRIVGSAETVTALLDASTDPNALENDGKLPFDCAGKNAMEEMERTITSAFRTSMNREGT